ncbi:hypothetical protein [Burkholderia sp. WSM2232]|uniref:hypothetical protein n=1 Tax=Burkholderia sp. WSM2232 TaxID=944436 RepID=UPI000406494D|nr:hypothetical protein [Burkholderia sp. WSM2232]
MIADHEAAAKMNAALLKAGGELNDVLAEIWSQLTDEEQQACQLMVGKILGEILLEGLNPLHAMHPDLKPEQLR